MFKQHRSAIVLTLVLAAMSLFAAACGGQSQAPGGSTSSDGSSPAEAGKPRYGGAMNSFSPTPRADVNIRSSSCAISNDHQPVWEGLLRWDPGFVSKPALAESWSSQDAQTYVFKLRQDVVWQDGKPFTSADVIVTFDHMKRRARPPLTNIGGTFLTDNGATYRAIDAHTVELKVKSPNTVVIPWLSSCSTMMMSKAVMDRNGGPQEEFALGKEGDINNAIGTGPFKLAKHDRDVEIIYEKFPNYWGKDAAGNKLPYLDGIHVFIIRDPALYLAAFRTNQIDFWPSGYPIVTKSDAGALKTQLGGKVSITPGSSWAHESLDLNNNHPLLKQRDMRWAINLIVDRQEVALRAAEGNLLPAFMDPEAFGKQALPLEEVNKMPGFRQPKTEDHAEARRLLAKLGVTPQTPVELYLPTRTGGFQAAAAQVVAKQLEPFGIKVKVALMEQAAVGLATGNYDMNTDIDTIKTNDAWYHMYAEADFTYRQSQPGLRWANEEAQKKLIDMRQEALVTADEAKRNAIYHEMQRFLYTVDTPHVTLGFDQTYHMWWNVLKGYKIIGGVTEGQRHDAIWLER